MKKRAIKTCIGLFMVFLALNLSGCDWLGMLLKITATGVSVSEAAMIVAVAETRTLTATVSPPNATDKSVSWSSDNTFIATVDQGGTITGVAEGTATVTAATADGGFQATCLVGVGAAGEIIIVVQ